MRLPLLMLLFLECCLRVCAQVPQQLRFEALTVNEGLSQGYVTSVIQDQKGFMWFGTNDGLNRYDGYSFTVYRHIAADTTSISDDAIRSIFEDSKGRLWIGTAYHGLELFDRKAGRFFHFPAKQQSGPSGNMIREISEDRLGNIWLATSGGLDRVKIEESDSDIQLHFQRIMPARTDDPSEDFPNVLNTGSATFVIARDRISQFRAGTKSTQFQLTTVFRMSAGLQGVMPMLLEDTLGHSYLLVTERSVIRFEQYDFKKPHEIYRSDQTIIARTIDKEGYLWIEDRGRFTRIHMLSGKRQEVLAEPALQRLVENTFSHYTDAGGVIWMPTSGFGLLKYHPARDYFHHISRGNNTYQILPAGGNYLIVNGRYLLRPHAGNYERPGGNIFRDWEADFDRSAAQADKSSFWIIGETGLSRITYSGRILQQVPFKMGELFPLFSGRDGVIWAGSDSLLVRFDPKNNALQTYPIPKRPRFAGYSFVQQIWQDENKKLWLATVSGLLHFDPTNQRWRVYQNKKGDAHSLSHNFVLSLCADPREPSRYLWVGTKGGGLGKLDKSTGKFENFTVQDGMPNNVVYGILSDQSGHLWISTNDGIADFNPQKKKFRHFTSRDGLQGNEFNRYAFAKRNDTLFFGGMNGINYFVPEQIRSIRPPRVFLTDFTVFNKPIDLRDVSIGKVADIAYAERIRLRYNQNMIGFTFAAADYSGTGRTHYRYRLAGLENEWITVTTSHDATYTNLSPGHYTFLAQASVDGVDWGKQQTLLTVDIVAPFWATWYFYVLLALLTGLVLYSIYRWRLQQILRVQHLRNRISRDLHDEIGSSLSTISIYSKVASAQLGNGSANPEVLLQKISENTEQAMEAMSDIIWSTNSENDDFENIINRMREHAVQLFEAQHYTLHFTEDESVRMLKLDMEKRKDFYLIYKETLNNIAKHAHGTEVWIDLSRSQTGIRLRIRDNGRGFDLAHRRSGNGISNMQNRANALKGKLTMTSEPGQGTVTLLEFPVR